MANLANTQDLVTIEDIRESTVILKGGAMRQVLMVGGLNFALKSEGEQNIITSSYQNFLNSLDFSVQIIIHSRKINIEKYLDDLEERMQKEQSALLQSQIGEYKEFVAGFVKENDIMAKTFFIVVPWAPVSLPSQETVSKFLPFLKKKGGAAEEEASHQRQQNFEQNLGQLKQRVGQVIEGLRAIDLEAEVLNDEQLIELYYNFYNPETVEKKGISMGEPREKIQSLTPNT